MTEIALQLPHETATRALGAELAPLIARGDVVCLAGPLGAGKTTLARGLIADFAGEGEVPSPTFALVETYPAPLCPLWHFDLYRLARPDDVYELGFDEALRDGATLIEWPERIASLIPANALFIRLDHAPGGRAARIAGGGDWPARLAAISRALESPDRN